MAEFTTSDGLRLYYDDHGDGLPVLCLPGLTRTTADFDYVLPYLDGYRVIRMDMRGRGRSEHDPNWHNYILPVECRDILELMDRLNLAKTAILGTSRGGLQAMGLAMQVKDRLLGVALNDVGPVLDADGLSNIMVYLGRRPAARTHADAAAALAHVMTGFRNVPDDRWMEEAVKHFRIRKDGLDIVYDPRLRDAVEAGGAVPDLWPFFDALHGLPLALIWGLNSDLLKRDTVDQMIARRPDMIVAEVPDRGHVPFLDEPESISALHRWLKEMQ